MSTYKSQIVKIAIITRRFFPHGDASGEIIKKFSEELLKNGFLVHVFSPTEVKGDTEPINLNGINVTKVYSPETISFSQLKQKIKTNSFSYLTVLMIKTIHFFIQKIFNPYRSLSLNYSLVKSYSKIIKKIKKDEFDLIIITMMPHEALWVYSKTNNAIPLIIYQLDSYWNNVVYPLKNQSNRWKFEKKMISNSLFTMTTPLIYKSNIEKDGTIKEKMIPVEFPMIVKQDLNKKENIGDSRTHLVFLGTLYPKIRPADTIIHIISKTNNPDLVFDFYGDKQEMIINCPDYSQIKDHIILHGMVSSEEASKIRNNADILVNIDNTNMNQVPSKIFEYINTGKPIINFYFNENSPTLDYLHKYPLCLNIKSDSSPKAANELIENFVLNNLHKSVSFEYIQSQFLECTPEFITKKFLDFYHKKTNTKEDYNSIT